MHVRRFSLPTVAGLLVSLCLPIPAQQIYVENSSAVLGVMNVRTGAFAPIGTTSERIGGFAAVGSTLYGIGDNQTLYTINTSTAGLVPIGTTGLPTSGYGLGETSNGTIYEIDLASGQSSLYTLSPSTGAATLVGAMGIETNSDPSGDDAGNLYDAQGIYGDGFYRIDPTTGASTLLGTNGSWGSVLAVTFVQGTMYALNTTGSIYSVDLTTGAATQTASYNTSSVGSVYAAGVAIAPSAPAPGALAVFGNLGAVGMGLIAMRRRSCRRR
jgi:hypothetical protein